MNNISHVDLYAITATGSMNSSALTHPIRCFTRQKSCMRKSRLLALILIVVASSAAWAQVLSPVEIKDPDLRSLQQQYLSDLKLVGQDVLALQFEYHFYLSRKLDLDESQQQHADQRSIRFDRYNGQTVLAVTGNYYAAYPADNIAAERRARSTFVNVVMPILRSEVPRFQSNHQVQGYALEISHHILGRVMGVPVERPENLMVFLPQSAAIKLLGSKDETAQQAGLMQGQVFLNAEPITIWLNGEGPQLRTGALSNPNSTESKPPADGVGAGIASVSEASVGAAPANPSAARAAKPNDIAPAPLRDTSPEALTELQASSQQLLGKLAKELDPQAHFVSYVPQNFVAFRQGIYLELSLNTNLPESAAGSRYKLAAIAFDDHVAHLIRPTLTYFREEPKFDGISFSTTIHLTTKLAAAGKSEAVEFFFPFASLRCYEKYDCTGQQLIDAGTVLINGERVALDLEIAEGGPSH
jgi:hypothetical protein